VVVVVVLSVNIATIVRGVMIVGEKRVRT
jgi:hypothetical protein